MCYNQKQGAIPTNLDKRIVALPSVQVPREIMTSNGCRVSLHFRTEENPRLHTEIAGMLIAAFTSRRSKVYETSSVSVQSIDQRAG